MIVHYQYQYYLYGIGELEKAELGELVCSSFLHYVIDKDVSLHEWMDGRKAL